MTASKELEARDWWLRAWNTSFLQKGACERQRAGKFRKWPLYMVSSEWAKIQLTGITTPEGAFRARLISDLYMVPPDS